MKVLLKRTWFVNGRRYRPSKPLNTPVELPDHLKDKLPSDAVVVGIDYKVPEVALVKEPETIAEFGKLSGYKSVPEALADEQAKVQADADAVAKSTPGQWPPEKKDASDA